MSEVYVLVKQVEGRPNGEVTLHGVTTNELLADTWSNAGENNISFWVLSDESPKFEPYQREEATDE